jgi:S-sulfo-L-cysteine synthase (3-phospho-L-serine-dependent)
MAMEIRTPDIVEAIGCTPLIRLRGIPSAPGQLFAKLELLNPFGMKDRAARRIIVEARRSGELREGAPIVESSSGTMALGVALVGRALDHPVHIVTDPRIDAITLAKLNALGCEVHVVERMSHQGWQSARLERLQALMAELPGAFWTRQYENVGNPLGYVELAHEILEQLGGLDVLVGPVGSGGSLCGTARELRARGMDIRVVGVDAVGSVIFGQPDQPARLQSGLGNSLIPPNVDFAIIDEVHWLSDAEAFGATYELARREQIFAGNSSGSAYLVARWLTLETPPGTRVVAILPDRGDRYVGTFYNNDYLREHRIDVRQPLTDAPLEAALDTPVESWSRAALRATTNVGGG